MAVLEIKKYPDPVLLEKAQKIEELDIETCRLMDNMVQTMYAAPGVGLAAPQVGVSKRVIVLDVSNTEPGSGLIVLANPEVVQTEGQVDSEEGCLSVPGLLASIKRAEQVVVTGIDKEGRQVKIEAGGLLSRVLQHEIDHLNGTIILQQVSLLKREFYKKRLKKGTAIPKPALRG